MRKNKIYFGLFLLFFFVTEFYYYNYRVTIDTFCLFDWMMEVLNDRFVVFLVQGIASAIIQYQLLILMTANDYRMLRYADYKQLIFMAEKNISGFVLISVGLLLCAVFGVALVGEGFESFFMGKEETRVLICIVINMLLMDFVLGNILLFMIILGVREKPAAFLVIGVLIYNIAITGNVRYAEKPLTKLTWAGNMLLSQKESYSVHAGYWLSWLILLILFCLIRIYVPWNRILQRKGQKKWFWIMIVGVAVIIFTILGFSAAPYLSISGADLTSDLIQYFYGFKNLNIYVFLYLLYQLPIWIIAYLFLIENMKFYFVQYMLRGKGVMQYLGKLLAGAAEVVILYYGIGIGVLAAVSRLVSNSEPNVSAQGCNILLALLNVFLQSIMIILIAFEIWLWDEEERHVGVVVTLALHLVLSVIAGRLQNIAAWIPLSGGIYWTHSDCQKLSCIVQLLFLLILLGGMTNTFLFKYDKILMRKVEA